jgi:hypothetical protein
MPLHPNPLAMATHVEHHRQELLAQARQERLAKEAIAGRVSRRRPRTEAHDTVVARARACLGRLRPRLAKPLELPQSTLGEA